MSKTTPPLVASTTSANGQGVWLEEYDELVPNLDEIITEDGKPVDNVYVERLYHLLVSVLYAAWQPPGKPGRSFLALANVGWFHTVKKPAIVPDVMLSLDVMPRDPGMKEGRSYFQWLLGKAPDVAIEVVSDERGGEYGEKMLEYARLGLRYYVVHDPEAVYDKGILKAFELRGGKYEPIDPKWIEGLGLGLTMWEGTFEGYTRNWLRWCDRDGVVLPTAVERAETAESRIQRLLAQLQQAGIKPIE